MGALGVSLRRQRCNVRHLVTAALECSGAAGFAFAQGHEELPSLAVVATTAGFFINAASFAFYSVVAQPFPSQLRAGGTGFVIGAGRAGSAVGPILAGVLFGALALPGLGRDGMRLPRRGRGDPSAAPSQLSASSDDRPGPA